jgi:hypothetical protein
MEGRRWGERERVRREAGEEEKKEERGKKENEMREKPTARKRGIIIINKHG